jgi:hypothetical protein
MSGFWNSGYRLLPALSPESAVPITKQVGLAELDISHPVQCSCIAEFSRFHLRDSKDRFDLALKQSQDAAYVSRPLMDHL